MAGFDFSTLSSSDFEELVRDLLNANEEAEGTQITYRTFKDGRDNGIDFLYSTPTNLYEIIGQVKHYYRSGVPALLRHLANPEAAKVAKLNPNRYIIATSLELTADNIKAISAIFNPYIKTIADIYDKITLNLLIDKFPPVLRKHFKLWFSSTEVLKTLLNYEVEGRSREFTEKELQKRLRLYVETPGLVAARNVLNKNNFVIITGEPGVGKTTTAELLIYEMIKDGYELIYIYDDIKEAEAVLNDKERKAVFYFDDFLGSTAVEINKAKGSETALIKTLNRIVLSKKKKFVFTTRTFILNNVVQESERLRHFNVKAQQSLISLSEYDNGHKLQMLNNHIDESDLNEKYKEVLRRNRLQQYIVNHPNFSPRSVAFITSSKTIHDIAPEVFNDHVLQNFNRPDEIWRHAYEQQIDDLSRLLLNTMVSFGNSVDITELEEAFNKRMDYEVQVNNFTKPLHAFRKAFTRVDGGFITADLHQKNSLLFINNSLIDFLVASIRTDKSETTRISEAAAFVKQLTTRLYNLDQVREELPISDRLRGQIENNYNQYIKPKTRESDLISLALFSHFYLNNEAHTMKLLSAVSDWEDALSSRETFTYFLKFLDKIDKLSVIELIEQLTYEIFTPLLLDAGSIDDFHFIITLANSKFSFEPAHSSELSSLNEHATNLLDEKIESDIDELKEYSHAQDYVEEKEQDSEHLKADLEEKGMTIRSNFHEYNAYDWYEIGMHNYFVEQMQKDD